MTENRTTFPAVIAPGRYRLELDRSQVRYSGEHMFGLGTVHATFSFEHGQIEVAEPIDASSATVIVDAASFRSNNARRDKDVVSCGLLDVSNYPKITFATQQLQRSSDGWLARGTLSAHDHTVPVPVRLDRVVQEGNGIRIHGRADHRDRTAFGITGSRRMVGRYLDIELDAFAAAV